MRKLGPQKPVRVPLSGSITEQDLSVGRPRPVKRSLFLLLLYFLFSFTSEISCFALTHLKNFNTLVMAYSVSRVNTDERRAHSGQVVVIRPLLDIVCGLVLVHFYGL